MTNIEIEIMMTAGCTKEEAKKHLKNGSLIFEDFEENYEDYAKEWEYDEDELKKLKEMVDNKKPMADWDIVKYNDKTYYIEYAL